MNNQIKDKTFCITGKLSFFSFRKDAFAAIVARGGITVDHIRLSCDYLICAKGMQSRKIEQCNQLRRNGHEIKLISEEDFIEMLRTSPVLKNVEVEEKEGEKKEAPKKPTPKASWKPEGEIEEKKLLIGNLAIDRMISPVKETNSALVRIRYKCPEETKSVLSPLKKRALDFLKRNELLSYYYKKGNIPSSVHSRHVLDIAVEIPKDQVQEMSKKLYIHLLRSLDVKKSGTFVYRIYDQHQKWANYWHEKIERNNIEEGNNFFKE